MVPMLTWGFFLSNFPRAARTVNRKDLTVFTEEEEGKWSLNAFVYEIFCENPRREAEFGVLGFRETENVPCESSPLGFASDDEDEGTVVAAMINPVAIAIV